MEFDDIKKLQEVADEYSIPLKTLQSRLDSRNLIEGVDCKRLGRRMPTLLSPEGVKKITEEGEK